MTTKVYYVNRESSPLSLEKVINIMTESLHCHADIEDMKEEIAKTWVKVTVKADNEDIPLIDKYIKRWA